MKTGLGCFTNMSLIQLSYRAPFFHAITLFGVNGLHHWNEPHLSLWPSQVRHYAHSIFPGREPYIVHEYGLFPLLLGVSNSMNERNVYN